MGLIEEEQIAKWGSELTLVLDTVYARVSKLEAERDRLSEVLQETNSLLRGFLERVAILEDAIRHNAKTTHARLTMLEDALLGNKVCYQFEANAKPQAIFKSEEK